MFFASYTEGFKSGGFGSFNLSNNAANEPALGNGGLTQADGFLPNQFQPETVDSFELGYKGSLMDGNANFDLTAFYYEYEDLQVVVADGGASIVDNVGAVEAWGLEGSITTRLNDYINLYLAMGYLDSEATELQAICGLEDASGCEGSSLFWAPEFSGAMVLAAIAACPGHPQTQAADLGRLFCRANYSGWCGGAKSRTRGAGVWLQPAALWRLWRIPVSAE